MDSEQIRARTDTDEVIDRLRGWAHALDRDTELVEISRITDAANFLEWNRDQLQAAEEARERAEQDFAAMDTLWQEASERLEAVREWCEERKSRAGLARPSYRNTYEAAVAREVLALLANSSLVSEEATE